MLIVLLSCTKEQLVKIDENDFAEMLTKGIGYVLNQNRSEVFEFDVKEQKGYVFDFRTSLKCEYYLNLYHAEDGRLMIEWIDGERMPAYYEIDAYRSGEYFRLKKGNEYFLYVKYNY